ncbi:2-C-methyl-D-erythritol 2,4-cyclodiphosphate synthase [Halospina denitrificans]|uniref:2-C-methyl-D-erythritol 2,4-cyclodiphosphate synthase n=1 Tax=Halospina denitrificans TaxID=332522 RepID=UPI00105FA0FD|nr:2-C-methyl-D-erythritol 2,4-cyclodiphosphate synthase [Halospina denitrificans]
MRVGQGFDVHAFEKGDHVVIGGVRIPHDHGLRAHSDGDVLLHTIADALLGAVALGDIGHWFPDTDQHWRDADSRSLLREVYRQVRMRGYRLVNLDATVIAQAPKMAEHVEAIRRNLAEDLSVDPEQVSVKATTSERLGFVGREEGIAAQAVCLVESLKADQSPS